MFNIITETFSNCKYIYYKNKYNILYYYKLTNLEFNIIDNTNELISDEYILCIHNMLNIHDYDAYITY